MDGKDFFESEKSTTMKEATDVSIEFVATNGESTLLKERVALQKDEVVDTAIEFVNSGRVVLIGTFKGSRLER